MNNTSNSSPRSHGSLVAEPALIDSSSTPQARRILLVEDDEAHARIIQRAFESFGELYELTHASTLSEGSQAMKGGTFDLVITDWRLPDGEGFELLKENSSSPLLIMTSQGNEQIAVEAMRAGALDYVVKSESSLLAMPRIATRAIQMWSTAAARELAEEQLRTAEEKLRERKKEEEWFRLVVEAAPYAMIVTGFDGLITITNSAAERLFWYRREELIGQPIEMLLPDPFRAPARWKKRAAQELFGLRRDGSEVPVEISIDPIASPDGQFVLSSVIDITERRKAAEHMQLFQALIEGVEDYAIYMLDPKGNILTWNEGAARIKGYTESEIVGQHFSLFYTPEDVKADRPGNALRIARAEGKFKDEGWRVRRDGSRFWASALITVLLDKHGNVRGYSKLTRDTTERREYEKRLLESERSLRLLADSMPQIVWTALPDGRVDYFNRQWYEFTGSPEDLAGDESWTAALHPDDVQPSRDCWHAAMESGGPYEIHSRLWDSKSEGYHWYLARALPLRDNWGAIVKWVGTATDIDDHKRLSAELEQRVEERTKELRESLTEKTTLLQEVHHRVKNNLQVVCSLLSMQITCSDAALSGPLHAAHSRILAMSLIHEQIYQSETLADLEFGAYVKLLVDRLFEAYCVDSSRIRLELNVEAMHLTVDQAIPCGLILNELVSNSLKHAFTDGREGLIRISLGKTEGGSVELTVADNGRGLPADFKLENSRSLGLQVVRTLIHQLRADLSIMGDPGAVFKFGWKLPASQ